MGIYYIMIKIMNAYSGNYITHLDKDLVLKPYEYNKDQLFTLDNLDRPQVDNLCMLPNNDSIELKPCSNTDKILYENNNIMFNNKCMDIDLKLHDCDGSREQEWVIQPENGESLDYRRQLNKGKFVVLVDKEDPWYINKDITTPVKVFTPPDIVVPNEPPFYYKQHYQIEGFNNINNYNIIILVLIVGLITLYFWI